MSSRSERISYREESTLTLPVRYGENKKINGVVELQLEVEHADYGDPGIPGMTIPSSGLFGVSGDGIFTPSADEDVPGEFLSALGSDHLLALTLNIDGQTSSRSCWIESNDRGKTFRINLCKMPARRLWH